MPGVQKGGKGYQAMTPEQKARYDEIQAAFKASEDFREYINNEIKDLKAKVARLEGYAESRIKNKQGQGAHSEYDKDAPDPPRPPLEEIGR